MNLSEFKDNQGSNFMGNLPNTESEKVISDNHFYGTNLMVIYHVLAHQNMFEQKFLFYVKDLPNLQS